MAETKAERIKRREVEVGLANNAFGAAAGTVATVQARQAWKQAKAAGRVPKHTRIGRLLTRSRIDPGKAIAIAGIANVGAQAVNGLLDAQSAQYFARERMKMSKSFSAGAQGGRRLEEVSKKGPLAGFASGAAAGFRQRGATVSVNRPGTRADELSRVMRRRATTSEAQRGAGVTTGRADSAGFVVGHNAGKIGAASAAALGGGVLVAQRKKDVSKAKRDPYSEPGRVLYRRASAQEAAEADRRSRDAAVKLTAGGAAVGGGYGAGTALLRHGSGRRFYRLADVEPLSWRMGARTALRRGGIGAAIGGAAAGSVAALARRAFKNEQGKTGVWTYEASPDASDLFTQNTIKRGRQATFAGHPDPDGEGFYGFKAKQVKKLPGDVRKGILVPVEKARRADPEADRQRRLGLYAGAGLGTAAVLGQQAVPNLGVERIKPIKLKDGTVKMPGGVKVTPNRKGLLLAAGSLAAGTGGVAAYKHGISRRNQPWT